MGWDGSPTNILPRSTTVSRTTHPMRCPVESPRYPISFRPLDQIARISRQQTCTSFFIVAVCKTQCAIFNFLYRCVKYETPRFNQALSQIQIYPGLKRREIAMTILAYSRIFDLTLARVTRPARNRHNDKTVEVQG